MRKIIILLTVSAYFFNLNCCQKHWMYPDGDRTTATEKAVVSCFIPLDPTDKLFECHVCGCILSIPGWSSLGAIYKELKEHLIELHPEEMNLIKANPGMIELINNSVGRWNLEERLFCSAQRPSQLPKKARFAKLTEQ